MKQIKNILFCLSFLLALQVTAYAQTYKNWEDEDVDEFYEKQDVKYGSLDEDGEETSFIFIPTTIKQGVYNVEIADYKNNLYEIKGTDYYVKFRGYYGYAGYGDEGVLVVGSSAYSSTFYKKP
jgi:hypothetical protein